MTNKRKKVDAIKSDESFFLLMSFALIPKNKSDFSTIEELNKLSPDDITPLLPKLLEWIQDINWPIAQEMIKILTKHQVLMVPILKNILVPEQTDDVWKYWIISALLPNFSNETLSLLLDELKRIATNPTEGEKIEECQIEAKSLLDSRNIKYM